MRRKQPFDTRATYWAVQLKRHMAQYHMFPVTVGDLVGPLYIFIYK
jgi:hypothetical protein